MPTRSDAPARHPLATPLAGAVVALAVLSGVLYGCTREDDAGPSATEPAGSAEAAGTIRYVAADPSTFVQPAVVQSWIDAPDGPDLDSIDGHAWDVWRALTAPTGQELGGTELPVWETWFSDAEVFLDNQDVLEPDSRDLDPPNQSLHSGGLAPTSDRTTAGAASAAVLSFNRFSREILDTVHQNRYYDRKVLQGIDDDADLAALPPALRTVPAFANTGVMVKPVWWIAPGDEPSMLPYWAGDDASATTDPQVPTWDTWRQCVLLDPTGDARPDSLTAVERVCNAGRAGESTLAADSYALRDVSTDVATSDFYAFRLTQDEVDGLGEFKMMLDNTNREDELDQVRAGDLAILVAMHVSTREITNWTWQTFWWTPTPSSPAAWPPNAQAPPRDLTGPWAQFNMCSAYYMTTPGTAAAGAGEDLVCFNPYLETDLTGLFSSDGASSTEVGRSSNCMSCHRGASFRASEPPTYIASGEVAADDPRWFTNGVQTEFLWSIPFHAHDGPFEGPTATATPTTASTTTQAPPTTAPPTTAPG
jgi:hypothetical protein